MINKTGTEKWGCDLHGPLEHASYILSKPRMHKHISFNGDLLHAASTLFDEEEENDGDDDDDDDDDDDEEEEEEDGVNEDSHPKRITFLVNIWLDHCPWHANPIDDSIVQKMNKHKTFRPARGVHFMDEEMAPRVVQIPKDHRILKWNFVSSDSNYDLSLPCPALDLMKSRFAESSNLVLYTGVDL